ncbi:MAG: UDP-N-acetylglucosamine 2-epimerase (non-hydrolyzing) [bacterium]|nr:UDP-N-acetylglucosamine 2-epimerase (non-hydrolyzing) [bacterium]
MNPIHVMLVFGTRPEAIKMAPVVYALRDREEFRLTSVVTGQHREMLNSLLELFKITPDCHLDIMQKNQTLSDITTRVLTGLDKYLDDLRPDVLLVQGDTTTAFTAGLAAFYHKIPVGHVEAGLRTGCMYDPFPEEMNRCLLTRIAELQFPPTSRAKENLLAEGTDPKRIYLTGNTVTDALKYICAELPAGIPDNIVKINPSRRMLLIETHRRENLGEPMRNICRALKRVAADFPDTELVFSVHPNPKVREVIMPMMEGLERVHLLEPMDYPDLVRLQRGAYLILTDSGGIQEEAPAFGVPTIVLRRTTERPEGIDSGNAILAGTDENNIYNEAARLLSHSADYEKMSHAANPYGDGLAGERIAQAILHHFGRGERPDEFVPGA